MEKNLLNNKKYLHLFTSMVLLTIMFVITETGVNLKIYSFITPYKITLLITGIMFLIAFLKNPKNMFLHSLDSVKNQLKEIKILIILIVAYIAFDLISLLYTNNKSVALTKYVTIISMVAIIFFYVLYLNKSKKDNNDTVNLLLYFLSAPSIIISLYTWAYMIIFKTTFYARRLSLIQDYNKFGMLLFFSYITLIYLIFRISKNLNKRNLALAISSIICTPTIFLTLSRRTTKMMSVVLILFCLYGVFDTYIKLKNKESGKIDKKFYLKSLIKLGITILITFLISNFIVFSYEYLTTERTTKITQDQTGDGLVVNRGADDILTDEHSMEKRTVIWKIAKNSYKEYPTLNKIIGKGASSNLDIYNQPENKAILDRIYWKNLAPNTVDPHNFLLVDLLNGGIILLGITMLCMLSILVYLFKLIKRSFVDVFFIFTLSIVILGDIMTSSRFGIFDNKFIWIILILLITVFNSLRNKDKTSKVIE